jgi:outer membrane protease
MITIKVGEMRTHAAPAVFLIVVFCFLGSTVGAVGVGLDFKTQKMFGHTTFCIEATEYFAPYETRIKVESELEFPLDVFLVGADMSIKGKLRTGESWSANLGVSRSINHPSGYMKDSDWIGLPEYNLREKFSFTESDAELKALLAYVEGRLGLMRGPHFILELLAGYEYQDFSFEIFGVRGWQWFGEDTVSFDTLHATNVLDYSVTYHIVYGGVAVYFQILPRLSLEAKGFLSPRLIARDHDHHLLRYKTADGDCSGRAFKLAADLRWDVLETAGKSNWFVETGFSFMKIDTKGTQEQNWYGDDPGSPEDDTGNRATGIRQEIDSDQTAVQAKIGYEF